jgi:drug/metabolite transporter (DMT)-like permease
VRPEGILRRVEIAVRRPGSGWDSPSPGAKVTSHASGWVGPPGRLLSLLALYACWGSSIPAMKLMVRGVPPLAGAGAVFTAGGVVLLSVGRAGRRPTGRQAWRAASVGLLLLVGGQGVATVVVTKLTASLAAVLLATVPLWIAVLARAQGSAFKVLLGLGGAAIALLTAPRGALGGSPLAVAACCVAAVLWAIGSLRASQEDLMPSDGRISTGIQLLAGGIVLLIVAAGTGQLAPVAWSHAGTSSLAAAGFLLVADSLAGFGLYTRLLRTSPISLVGSYAYATPLVAAAIGFVAFGEPLWPGLAIGALLIIAAVILELHQSPDKPHT